MRKRKVFFRIRKIAPKRYLIEERHTFMFFWRFYTKGSIKFKIPKYYISPKHAETAIHQACAKKGYQPFILSIG